MDRGFFSPHTPRFVLFKDKRQLEPVNFIPESQPQAASAQETSSSR